MEANSPIDKSIIQASTRPTLSIYKSKWELADFELNAFLKLPRTVSKRGATAVAEKIFFQAPQN